MAMTETKSEASNLVGKKSDPRQEYESRKKIGTLKPDELQEQAVEKLQHLYGLLYDYEAKPAMAGWRAWFRFGEKHHKSPQGLYIFGPVGRGKSMLTDLFFECAPVKCKRRIHFHEFMIEVHDAAHAWRKSKVSKRGRDPLLQIAKSIASEASLLCFDEFHVTNVADAMILGRLFENLFELGVVIVLTSNFEPDLLYKDGLQRERFLPCIELLKQRLDPIELNSPIDYRLARLKQMKVFHFPLGPASTQALEKSFFDLTEGALSSPEIVSVKGRDIKVNRAARGVAWFGFDQLCGEPRGAEDYLNLGKRFHTIILDGVPHLTEETRNEAKRFITLIDTLYELRVNLVMAASTAPHDIYKGATHAFEFERTLSRLMEMQADDYIDTAHQGAAG